MRATTVIEGRVATTFGMKTLTAKVKDENFDIRKGFSLDHFFAQCEENTTAGNAVANPLEA